MKTQDGAPLAATLANNTGAAAINSGLVQSSGSSGGMTAEAYFASVTLETLRPIPTGSRELVINRDTGEISLSNTMVASIDNIIGYSLLSPAGSFDQTN